MVPRRLIGTLGCAALALSSVAVAAPSLDLVMGKRLFERNWVSAPSSTKSDDGLGPLYDAPSCVSCHAQNPASAADQTSTPPGMVVRLGNAHGGVDPVYGAQLQTRGVAGQVPEANPEIRWIPADTDLMRIMDAEDQPLQKPTVTPRNLGYGPLAKDTRLSLRRAPSLRGVGLLAQIPESEILSRADTEDANHDGIAGRAAWVMVNGKRVLGRFGWRATQPDLAAQTAIAFSRDIGLSTRLEPGPWGDCTETQRACRAGPHGAERGEPEVADQLFDLIVDYLAKLPSPPPPEPGAGQQLFTQIGCAACHATLHLANGTPVAAYTDLLLHDMGAGLGDGIEEGAADPWFWRTAPLWDVAGSLKMGGLLHDGRARNVTEAIEWHQGEAASARSHFRALTPSDKAALVAFVSGL